MAPLGALTGGAMRIRLVHRQSGRVVAEHLETARTAFERMRGLLGRSSLPEGEGMLIERCSSIHTFFMRFPLDVIFVSPDLVVRKVCRDVRPWRLARAWGARHVFELPAGALEAVAVAPGDSLRIEDT